MKVIGSKLFILILLSILGLPVLAQDSSIFWFNSADSDPNRGKIFYTTADNLNVRSDAKGAIVGKYPEATRIVVIQSDGNWLKVVAADAHGNPIAGSQPGYVYRKFLSRRQPDSTAANNSVAKVNPLATSKPAVQAPINKAPAANQNSDAKVAVTPPTSTSTAAVPYWADATGTRFDPNRVAPAPAAPAAPAPPAAASSVPTPEPRPAAANQPAAPAAQTTAPAKVADNSTGKLPDTKKPAPVVSKKLECAGDLKDKKLKAAEFQGLQGFLQSIEKGKNDGTIFNSKQGTAFQITGTPQVTVNVLDLSPKLRKAVALSHNVSEERVTQGLADANANPPFNAFLCTQNGKFYMIPVHQDPGSPNSKIEIVPNDGTRSYKLTGPVLGVEVNETFSEATQ